MRQLIFPLLALLIIQGCSLIEPINQNELLLMPVQNEIWIIDTKVDEAMYSDTLPLAIVDSDTYTTAKIKFESGVFFVTGEPWVNGALSKNIPISGNSPGNSQLFLSINYNLRQYVSASYDQPTSQLLRANNETIWLKWDNSSISARRYIGGAGINPWTPVSHF